MKRLMIFAITILTFILFGCSQNNLEQGSSATASLGKPYAKVTDFSDRVIILEQEPKKIVSLGNGEIDIIYALGGEVIGRPTSNGLPPLADTKDIKEVGSTHGIDLEIVTSLEPDIILGNDPMNLKDIASIENIGAQMILTRANSVEDIKKQVQLFGEVLKKETKAKEITDTIDDKVNILKQVEQKEKKRVLLIYGAPGSNMIALPNSLSGNILELAGGINIANDYPKLEAYPQYAQLNAERIIESDPHIILFMGHGNPDAVKDSFLKEMTKSAGWQKLEAVKNERFEILPPELFGTNPGTRVIEALDYLNDLFKEIE